MEELDIKTLETAGLTHAQSIIYLELLELGLSKVGIIIEKTKLQSSVVHNNINKLIDKGLISFILKGKVRHYQVSEPDILLSYLDKAKEKIDKTKEDIKKILPRLKSIRNKSKQNTEVEVYKGKRGFETAFIEEYQKLTKNQIIQFIALSDKFYKGNNFEELFEKLNEIAFEKNAFFKGIDPESLKSKQGSKNRKNYNIRYIKEHSPWDITIFKENILISIWGDEPVIIKIRNKSFYKNTLEYFEETWKTAKK